MAVAAYVLGARVIEKHFTLESHLEGHRPRLLAGAHRHAEAGARSPPSAGGARDGDQVPVPSEQGPLTKMGKKLVAGRALAVGHVLTEDDVAMKSPGDGLPPYLLDQVVGRTLTRALQPDDNITFEVLAQGEAE